MDILLSVFLPLALAFIMFSLGLGLTASDFAEVARKPKAFAVGALGQVVLLPLITFCVVAAAGIRAELAVGFMVLAACPGGVTTSMISKLARADVALSVSLTAIVSLLSAITVPILLAWSIVYFMGAEAVAVDVTRIALSMFVITVAPIVLGMLVRRFRPDATRRIERIVGIVAAALFAVIVLGALAANWRLFVENVAVIGPALILLNLILLGVGIALPRLIGLPADQAKTISIELGVQNSTVGITVAALLAPQAASFSAYALPAAIYGVLMYLVTLPVVAWYRRLGDARRGGG